MHLPFNEIIGEDELHILITCPKYHQERLNLQEGTKSLPLRNEAHDEMHSSSCEHIRIFGPNYVKEFLRHASPERNDEEVERQQGNSPDLTTENSHCFEHLQFIECWLMILSDEKFEHKS